MQELRDITAELSRLSLDAWLFMLFSLVLLIACGWLLLHWLRGRGRVQRVLRGLGCPFKRDLVIPDGIGGQIHLDYLLLTPKGLVVLDIKNYRGALFGGAHIPTWTQMVGGGSYKFTNPLPQNNLRVQAVKMLVREVPVRGRVVFTAEGHFPKGLPEGVSLLEELAADVGCAAGGEIPGGFQDAWAVLLAQDQALEADARASRQSA